MDYVARARAKIPGFDSGRYNVAICGQRGVGKSSLTNRILNLQGENQAKVSDKISPI